VVSLRTYEPNRRVCSYCGWLRCRCTVTDGKHGVLGSGCTCPGGSASVATVICDHCDGTGKCWESLADDFSEGYDYDCQNCDGAGALPIVAEGVYPTDSEDA
jgi:hypothetical protein